MVKFGPSSTDELFIMQGHKDFVEMPKWLSGSFGLSACEYPFNLGIHLSDEKAVLIGQEAEKYKIEMTAHAPYYINYANPLDDFESKSNAYVVACLKKLKLMCGRKLVIHLGSAGKMAREDALRLIETRLKKLPQILDDNDLKDVVLCFETMGKYSQIGNYQELAPLTNIDRRFNLTLDFGHINCTMQGGLKTQEDYQIIFDDLSKIMPKEKIKDIHIHFSRILYNDKGETKHARFDDFDEPPFEPLARVIKKNEIQPIIICESKGSQAQDAMKMKNIFKKIL